MGGNVKEFLRLVEEFVNMIGLQMSGFQDIYEVTENLGEPPISFAGRSPTLACTILSPAPRVHRSPSCPQNFICRRNCQLSL